MSKRNNIVFRDHLPKVEKVKLDKQILKPITEKGMDFIKLGEVNNVDFTAFFVMFNVWLQVPDKEAVIVKLVKDGKVDLGEDVRKDSEGQ